MKLTCSCIRLWTACALGLAVVCASQSARANVYATDIQLNGSVISREAALGQPVTISYILNEPATEGVVIHIFSGTNVIRTLTETPSSPGSLRGRNAVVWDGNDSSNNPVGLGTYSLTITAGAVGFTNWTQTSIDTNSGAAAYFPRGMDVDRNTNSPYYGRVVMGCAASDGTNNPSAMDGLYKMNADGSQADEGWFGDAGYTNDDGGDAPTPGQMPSSGGFNPDVIRIGEDDRIYWVDNTYRGAVVAADIRAQTNQMVINESGYANCPEAGDLASDGFGIQQFDVSAATTTNAAVYLVDTGDYPSWGVWMWHLTNGVADPNDTVGTQVVATGGDLVVTSAGIMMDYNLDIFVSQDRTSSGDPLNRTFLFSNWDGGILPPGGSSFADAVSNNPTWGVGGGDDSMTGIWDTVIDSRTHPTKLAVAMADGAPTANGPNGGIRILNATNGAILVSNLDSSNSYYGVAFDNVGNVYGCSDSAHVWRVWSPPGTNQATTVVVAKLSLVIEPVITGFSFTKGSITIDFTGGTNDPASVFGLAMATNVAGPYSLVPGAMATGSGGTFSITGVVTNAAAQFYRIIR